LAELGGLFSSDAYLFAVDSLSVVPARGCNHGAGIMRVLITGAAGNLGSLLSRHLLARPELTLRLMIHRRDVPDDLKVNGKTEVVQADLSDHRTHALLR
jgi:hypothetical protein